MPESRYQYQTRIVQLGRWLRWKPWFALRAISALALWVATGAFIPVEDQRWLPTWRAYAAHIWTCYASLAAIKMQHLYTIAECMEELRWDDPTVGRKSVECSPEPPSKGGTKSLSSGVTGVLPKPTPRRLIDR